MSASWAGVGLRRPARGAISILHLVESSGPGNSWCGEAHCTDVKTEGAPGLRSSLHAHPQSSPCPPFTSLLASLPPQDSGVGVCLLPGPKLCPARLYICSP